MELIIQEARDTNKSRERADSIFRSIKFKRQIALIIEVSSMCNLNCNFCDFHSGKFNILTSQKKIMDEQLYYKIIQDISDLGYKLKALHFHGWGEPLLQRNLPEMIHFAYDKSVAEKYILITNGVLMNKSVFEKLLVSGVDEIRVSLDTVNSEKYLKTKGGNFLQKVLDNIDYAISRISSKDKLKLYIKIPGLDSHPSFGITNEDTQEVIDRFKHVENPNVKIILQPLMLTTDSDVKDYTPCEQVFYTALIRFDGRVSPCCVDIYNKLTIGDVTKQSLLDILNSEKLRRIRTIHINGMLEKIPQCVYCGFRTPIDLSSHSDEIKKYLQGDLHE